MTVRAPEAPSRADLPALEPTTRKFVDATAGGPPLSSLPPDQARAVLSKVQASGVPRPDAKVEDATWPGGPTGSVRVRLVRPKGAKGALPAVLYLHGGGWVLGGPDTHDRLVRELAVGAGAVVVFVDYERAPEARFPVALEQAWAALQHLGQEHAALGVDPTRIAVVGDSAGATLATALARLARDRRGPTVGLQVLLYPVTDAGMDTASYRAYADGPWLTLASMRWFWDAYAPDAATRKDPLAAPLQASTDELRGLPDALVIVAENDVLRDEGEAYARRLAEAGVRVTAVRYDGTIHDFAMLDGLAATPAARAATAQAVAALQAAFAAEEVA